ncbi:hypothetical protein VB618_15505 [Microvirga sp. CF3062]|uniref:hypothetical protein n=1 Tax=Microvirga sp. CF3062 TaxID=3110182 RepID=UPI002E7A0CCF|nr:hypothetical protein [Microvirga sp. CF3062]MEE1657612.1 hypothetical protein [Microvirga sp. CF3062]
MRPLSKARFDALAGYARQPLSFVMAQEVGWFEHGNERVLATLIRDNEDGDYASIIMGRDRKGRFRGVHVSQFNESRRHAEVAMRREMEAVAHRDDAEYFQGDEAGEPLDFFTPVVAWERLHPDFLKVVELEGFSSARGIIEPMMHWYEDPDGNFVEQFQTTGFDARIWELYLFAAFSEIGYQIDRSEAVPDFTCKSLGVEFCVEATTVNASREGPLATPPSLETNEGCLEYLREFMPLKYGSALYTKFKRKYWEKPNVKGKPLIFAIADFQGGPSMIMTRSGLPIYLYGYDYSWHKDETGRLHIAPRQVEKHQWGTKEIPSGFFNQPGAENISAVVFNNSGTISKFLRMGMLAGFGSPGVALVREGKAVDHDPNATEPLNFTHLVNSPDYNETWVEGFDVFHNPNALHPLEEWLLPGASHHWLLPDKQMLSHTPDWQPLGSMTHILVKESATVESA